MPCVEVQLELRRTLLGGDDLLEPQAETVLGEGRADPTRPAQLAMAAIERPVSAAIHLDSIPAQILRRRAGPLPRVQDVVRGEAGVGVAEQAHARGEAEAAAVPDELMGLDGAAKLLADGRGAVHRTVREEHGEAVAVDPGDEVLAAHLLPQPGSDLLEQLIPPDDPAGLVDDREAVEVEMEHDVPGALPKGLAPDPLEPGRELLAGGETTAGVAVGGGWGRDLRPHAVARPDRHRCEPRRRRSHTADGLRRPPGQSHPGAARAGS
jgi:hypothetical protein